MDLIPGLNLVAFIWITFLTLTIFLLNLIELLKLILSYYTLLIINFSIFYVQIFA